MRKPGKNATPQQKAAYREAKKTHNLSKAFVEMLGELRHDLDSQGFADQELIAVGDGSFCNQTTFRQALDRTILLTRARKDLRLCFAHQGPGPRYYGTELFSPESVYQDSTIPWKETKIFHSSKYPQGPLQGSRPSALATGRRPAAFAALCRSRPSRIARLKQASVYYRK